MNFLNKIKKLISGSLGIDENNTDTRKTIEHKIVLSESPDKTSSPTETTSKTIGELQNEPMSAWGGITGLQFHATMQLSTPLRVLLRHGEIHRDANSAPPKIIINEWEGIWLPESRLREMLKGTDFELPESQCVSDFGLVTVKDYLPYLIAVRRIIETYEPVEDRITKLRNMKAEDSWEKYWFKGKSAGAIIGKFFPDFVSTIPNIGFETKEILSSLKMDTPNRIAAATDEKLLSIKGIGPKKLKIIRDYCDGIKTNRDDICLDLVTR